MSRRGLEAGDTQKVRNWRACGNVACYGWNITWKLTLNVPSVKRMGQFFVTIIASMKFVM